MIIKNAYTDSEMLPYCESVANVSAAAGAAIFESREMICARMGITGLETVSRFASEAAAAIRDENVTALLLNKIIKWIGFCDAGTIFNAMDYFSRALAADREDALRIFAEFGESGFWEEAECEDNPGNIAEASNYIFSLMSAFKSRFAGLVSGCVALYKRRGVEGIDRVVSFVGGLSACGGGFSAAFIKNGAALVDGIGYEGVKRLAQYRAAFEGVSYEMTLGWIERCPDIIAALGYDWLDEITGIYLRTIGSNPEFGLALITKSNEIIERSGFDMLYAMVNNSGQLPAGHAGLAECWIEGCFKVAAAAGESGSGGGVAVLEKFARRTRELFDENHNRGSAFARGETESFSDFIVEIFDGLKLSRIKNVLAVYLEALLGAKLAIVEADSAYTDGVKIYLPSSVTEFRNKEMNFTMYKVLATHEEAHIEYGSFDFEMDAAAAACTKVRAKYGLEAAKDGCEVEKFCSLFPEPSMASYIFNMFEDFRIESRLVSEYPMLGQQIRQVNERLLTKRPRLDSLLSEKERTIEIILQAVLGRLQNASCSGAPAAILREMLPKIRGLRSASSGAHDSAALAAELYILIDEACAEPYEPAKPLSGPLNQAVVEGNIGNFKRASRELNRRLNRPRVPLAGGAEAGESGGNGTEKHDGERSQAKGAPSGKKGAGGASDEKVEKMLRELFKKRGVRPSEIEAAAANMDDESLRAYVSGLRSSLAAEEEESQKRGKSYPYPEWGSDIGEYRPNVALVHETECEPAPDDEFYAETVSKRRGLIKSVLREFKMIKPADNAFSGRKDDGEELDPDPMLEYIVDRKLKRSPSEKVYAGREKKKRSVAVAILLDRSGSTMGDVIGCEKESLVIMSEALAALGDDFAIYAYDSYGPENCNFFVVKEFGEKYDGEVKKAIGGLYAGGGTATGSAIRHASFKLKRRQAKTKLIMLLTDGAPNDTVADPVEDTRMALKEAKKQSIHSFCITVDSAAPDYLPRMYGHSSWVVIDDVAKLPEKIVKIYKRLTN